MAESAGLVGTGLAHLSGQLRWHALARSPLEARIDVLRRLVQADPGSPFWQEDLRTLERAARSGGDLAVVPSHAQPIPPADGIAAAAEALVELLGQLRLHSLARSPLSTRIELLRRIAELAPQSPVWQADLRAFEASERGEAGAIALRQEGLAGPSTKTAASAEEALEELLGQLRWHVLADSPLQARIDIMRRIAQIDASNPTWQDELRTFELAAQRQV